jgi:transcriptional regulator GlxA family with amidase domain
MNTRFSRWSALAVALLDARLARIKFWVSSRLIICRTCLSAASISLWIDLIEHYVTRFAEPLRTEDRLRSVWDAVQKNLARNWTVASLAKEAKTSGEHLRRLCQRSLGRSPMRQLTYLRVQYAAHRLATTDEKIEMIARDVGYQNPFAFSNTFKRMTGFRPSRYQMHRSAKTK